MKKAEAIKRINNALNGRVVNHKNTSFSNVNAAKSVWWLNIPRYKFAKDLHIILAKANGSRLIWLRIEANTFAHLDRAFRIRDTGAVDLEISCNGSQYMCDIKSGGTGYNFRRHIEYEWDE